MTIETINEKIIALKELKGKIQDLSTEYYLNLREEGMTLEESNEYVDNYNKLQEVYENNDKIIQEAIKELNDEEQIITENYYDEIINEAHTVYSKIKIGNNPAIFIHFDDESIRGEGFIQDPYVGIYDGPTFNKSKNMVRVGLLTGNLLNHSNSSKKYLGHLSLNSDQLKWFLKNKDNFRINIFNYLLTLAEEYKKTHSNFNLKYGLNDILNFNNYTECRDKSKLQMYNSLM